MRACAVIPSLGKHRQTMVQSYSYHRSSFSLLFFSSNSLRNKSNLFAMTNRVRDNHPSTGRLFYFSLLVAIKQLRISFHTRLSSQFLINCWLEDVFWCSMQTRNTRIHCSFTALSLERCEHDINASISSRRSDASDIYSIFFSSEFCM